MSLRLCSSGLFAVLLFGVGLLLAACQAPTSAETVVTIEVTRPVEVEVEVTRQAFATVQVPVEVTRQVFIPEEATPEPLPGSAERPLRLVFAPVAESAIEIQRATAIETALEETTGLAFQVITPPDYAAFVEQACADSAETIALMPALIYPLVHDQCGLEAQYTGLRDGLPWSAAMIVVPFAGAVPASIEELDGLTWGLGNASDLFSGLYYQARFAEAGIEPGEMREYGSEAAALISLAEAVGDARDDDELDFVTARYVPPILPFDERPWRYGEDDPELWREVSNFPRRSGIGFVVVSGYVEDGGYRVRDARAAVLDTATRIFIDTTILDVSQPIPNGVIAFGAAMPLSLASELGAALETVGASAECAQALCAGDLFRWEGIAAVNDAAYDPVRDIITQLDLDEEAVLNYLEAAP